MYNMHYILKLIQCITCIVLLKILREQISDQIPESVYSTLLITPISPGAIM